MSHKLLYLLFVCSFFVGLTGCLESDTDGGDDLSPFISTSTVQNGTFAKGDTAWFEINVAQGRYYTVSGWSHNEYDLWFIVETSEKDTLKHSSFFKAVENGIYRVGVYVFDSQKDSSAMHDYSLRITTFDPLPDEIEGQWVLLSEKASLLESNSEYVSSPSDPLKVVTFKSDTISRYEYSAVYDSVIVANDLYFQSYLYKYCYGIFGDTLILSTGNSYGEKTYVYEKYSGDISSLKWAKKNFKAPKELCGSWYLSTEKQRDFCVEEGITWDSLSDESFNENESLVKIDVFSDSVTYYLTFGQRIVTYPVRRCYDLLINSDGQTLKEIYLNAEFWTEDNGEDGVEALIESNIYKRYSGELPPDEWN